MRSWASFLVSCAELKSRKDLAVFAGEVPEMTTVRLGRDSDPKPPNQLCFLENQFSLT